MRTRDDLRILQALPLDLKIRMTKRRIWEWIEEYGEDGVYVSWSGGKDSTVLRHIVMQDWPNVESVFVNTGLEYPEIQRFVRAAKDRGEPVTILRPDMRFDEVIKRYGYPVISKEASNAIYGARRSIKKGNFDTVRVRRMLGTLKNKDGKTQSMFNHEKYRPLLDVDFIVSDRCCSVMKKNPVKKYGKKTGRMTMTAQMAEESRLRTQNWLQNGCNGFNMKRPISNPMSFWTEQDVLEYIKIYSVEIADVYGDVVYREEPGQMRMEEFTGEKIACEALCTTGCDRTGCIFCGFGAHLDKGESRFEMMKRTHPRQYEYCIGGGEYAWIGEVLTGNRWRRFEFIGEDGEPMTPEQIEEFVESHQDNKNFWFEKVWQPSKEGLGMGHVFDELNRIYGEGFIRYK